MTLTEKHHHVAVVGVRELHFWNRDDRYVKRAVARWLRLIFKREAAYIRQNYPGSMAAKIVDDATVHIVRWRVGPLGSGMFSETPATIEREFPISDESIAEFSRVWDS